jgi:hypothetical protein
MLKWEMLHPQATMEHLGYIPDFISDRDPRSAVEQFHSNYAFGGWHEFKGFRLLDNNGLAYPGDPVQMPIAKTQLRHETIFFYPSSWVAVVQPDRTFSVARLD